MTRRWRGDREFMLDSAALPAPKALCYPHRGKRQVAHGGTQRGDTRMESRRVNRRTFLRGAAAVSVGLGAFPAVLRAQPRTIKIGMVEPLSGPMSDVGQDSRLGAQIAVDAINAAGGIRSLDGAKLELLTADSQTKVE